MANILLIGGTGTVGSETAAALGATGVSATVAARNPGPGGIALDVAVPESLAAAHGFDTAFLLTPIGPDESAIGIAAVQALRRAGVTKIVYLAIMNLEAMRAIPHFEAKIPIKAEVLSDGRSVVVEANFFQSNDRMILPAILGAGVYPLPVGETGVWSVAPADLGQACANALVKDDWAGKAVPLCGPERLTGPQLAANWAQLLGRPVIYPGNAVEPFLQGLASAFPLSDWLRDDMKAMLEVTQAMGCLATPEQQAQSAALLGRPAIRHSDTIATLVSQSSERAA
jgi:uncharacterized protein YbjT (DUF2867 family)